MTLFFFDIEQKAKLKALVDIKAKSDELVSANNFGGINYFLSWHQMVTLVKNSADVFAWKGLALTSESRRQKAVCAAGYQAQHDNSLLQHFINIISRSLSQQHIYQHFQPLKARWITNFGFRLSIRSFASSDCWGLMKVSSALSAGRQRGQESWPYHSTWELRDE